MTPNTSDSPEAIRNRNIAAVSPPRNWLNRKDGSIAARRPQRPSPAPREREGPTPRAWEGEGSAALAPSPGRRWRDGHPLPRCGRGERLASPSLRLRLRLDVFG